MKESTTGLAAAAVTHLRLLRAAHETQARQDREYVTRAFQYGLTVPQIVDESGLPLARVRHILGGA